MPAWVSVGKIRSSAWRKRVWRSSGMARHRRMRYWMPACTLARYNAITLEPPGRSVSGCSIMPLCRQNLRSQAHAGDMRISTFDVRRASSTPLF